MAVEKHHGKYRIRWRQQDPETGRIVRKSISVPTKRQADDLETEIRYALKTRGFWEPPRPRQIVSFRDLSAIWLRARALKLRPRTLTRYGEHLEAFNVWLEEQYRGPVGASVLDEEQLIAYHAHLVSAGGRYGRGLKESTALKHIEAIQLCWDWVDRRAPRHPEWGEVPRSQKLDLRRPPIPEVFAPTWEECDQMLEAARGWHWYAARVARDTGLRRSALLLLKWSDVDLDEGWLTVRAAITKGGYGGRTLPLTAQLQADMAGWPSRATTWVIPAPEGERVSARGDGRGHIDKDFGRAWRRAGVRREAWVGQPVHAFRKTLETELLMAGVGESVIDHLLGHSTRGTGRRHYAASRAFRQRLVEAVQLIPRVGESSVRAMTSKDKVSG